MSFVIRNGNEYIAFNGKEYVKCDDIADAKKFKLERKARSILKSCLCKPLKMGATIIRIDDNDEEVFDDGSSEEIEKIIIENNTTEYVGIPIEVYGNKMMEFRQMIIDANNKSEILSKNLSIVDRKISDVCHLIELHKNFNTPDGYTMYKILRDLYRDRRKIKNEMAVINRIKYIDIQKDFEDVTQLISNLETKKYTPRELPELFSDM